MKPIKLAIVLFLSFPALTWAGIVFSGAVCEGETVLVCLRNTDSDATSAWFKVGGSFHDFTIIAYDSKNADLLLKKGGEEFRVSMAQAAITETNAPVIITGTMTVRGSGKSNDIKLQLVDGVEQIVPLEDGRSLGLKLTRLPDGKLRYDVQLTKADKVMVPDPDDSTREMPVVKTRVRKQSAVARPQGATVITVDDLSLRF